jgi:Fe-S cluster assembly ATP-binding protein
VLNKQIISNFSLSASKGQIIALIGPNGSGKSTLLKSLLNHYSTNKNKGAIYLDKTNITKLPTTDIAKLGIFYANQTPVDLPGVKAIDFLKSIIANTQANPSFSEVYKQIDNSLKQMGFDSEILQQPVNHHLSGGQKKRFEIVQANLFAPKVLLLDEIDSGLDVDAMKLIAKNIKLRAKSMITIVVSHHVNFLKMLAPNKVYMLSSGKIVYSGDNKILAKIENQGFNKYMQTYLTKPEFIKQDPYRVCPTKKLSK